MFKYQVRTMRINDHEYVQIVDDEGKALRLSSGEAAWRQGLYSEDNALNMWVATLCCEAANAGYAAGCRANEPKTVGAEESPKGATE